MFCIILKRFFLLNLMLFEMKRKLINQTAVTIKVIFLFSILLITDSCNDDKDKIRYTGGLLPTYSYDCIHLSIQDASGNDLVKGIEYDWFQSDVPEEEVSYGTIKRDEYTLDIVYFPDSMMSPYVTRKINSARPDFIRSDLLSENVPTLRLKKIDGIYFLEFHEYSNYTYDSGKKKLPPANKITFNLTCPYIFGDNTIHEIATYWKPKFNKNYYQSDKLTDEYYQTCYCITLDGNEYDLHHFALHPEISLIPDTFLVTVILER